MFLSIIIPVYKVEPYLRECLDSIVVSSSDCWEAILIDDGSPDCCPQICDEYAARDNRFRVVHKGNGGVSSARNAGLDIARGEWIWFVDSDDIVDMQKVDDMLLWLKEHKDVDLVMFDLKNFNDGSVISKSTNENSLIVTDGELSKNDFLLKHICYHHPRLWYSRGWINHPQRPLRFTEGIRLAEDLEFQYKYLTICQHPVRMNVILYYYRLRGDSATGGTLYRKKAVEDIPMVLDNLAEWTKTNAIKAEPWYDYRIMKMLQNLLYSASLVKDIEYKAFQTRIRRIIKQFRELEFGRFYSLKIRIAYYDIRLYLLLNKMYLKIKGL